ncbi:hypothetical protein BGZ88_007692 [Linnemannia elongata]|nr:hypothetical protein BGZ88_007692 [Linnemannia elongata]
MTRALSQPRPRYPFPFSPRVRSDKRARTAKAQTTSSITRNFKFICKKCGDNNSHPTNKCLPKRRAAGATEQAILLLNAVAVFPCLHSDVSKLTKLCFTHVNPNL